MAELLKIEKNIPLPSSTRTGSLRKIVESMEVGDSFLMKESSKTSVYNYGKPLRLKFSMQKQDGGIVRVWRRA